MKRREARLKGVAASEADASRLLERAGDFAIVERGTPRLLVMKCPDECGDTLRINLDRRTAKAWRLYRDEDGISLFPSVWRDTGCRSHFIVWGDSIYWNDYGDRAYRRGYDLALRRSITGLLDMSVFRSAADIAEQLGVVPWSVGAVLDLMSSEKLVEHRHFGREKKYRLAANDDPTGV